MCVLSVCVCVCVCVCLFVQSIKFPPNSEISFALQQQFLRGSDDIVSTNQDTFKVF